MKSGRFKEKYYRWRFQFKQIRPDKLIFGMMLSLLVWAWGEVKKIKNLTKYLSWKLAYWPVGLGLVVLVLSQGLAIADFMVTNVPQIGAKTITIFAIGFMLLSLAMLFVGAGWFAHVLFTFMSSMRHYPRYLQQPKEEESGDAYGGSFDSGEGELVAMEQARKKFADEHGFIDDKEMDEFMKMGFGADDS